jgi:hypothetical protein
MFDMDPTLIEAAVEAIQAECKQAAGTPSWGAELEVQVVEYTAELGRQVMKRVLECLDEVDEVVEEGVRWSRVTTSSRKYMTRFGTLEVTRGLYRSERNGPVRCFVEERMGILDSFWTSEAARVAMLILTDTTSRMTAHFFDELGSMNPSRSSLDRLPTRLSRTWEANREHLEAEMRDAYVIPEVAVTVAVMLDGVMIHMQTSTRKELKERARREGRKIAGPVGYKEASVAALAFYDVNGNRVLTRRFGRMPEPDKSTLKQILRSELEQVRRLRPELLVVAISDGAPNNWSFLESLNPDLQIVDFYHTVEHLSRRLDRALGAGSKANQRVLRAMRHVLLTDPQGHVTVFRVLEQIERRHGTWKKRRKTGRGTQPTYYERHHGRMAYCQHLARRLLIGSGVIEGTCRHVLIDRLRGTGMRWSDPGGQAILTFRALLINDQFNEAWSTLMRLETKDRQTAQHSVQSRMEWRAAA